MFALGELIEAKMLSVLVIDGEDLSVWSSVFASSSVSSIFCLILQISNKVKCFTINARVHYHHSHYHHYLSIELSLIPTGTPVYTIQARPPGV